MIPKACWTRAEICWSYRQILVTTRGSSGAPQPNRFLIITHHSFWGFFFPFRPSRVCAAALHANTDRLWKYAENVHKPCFCWFVLFFFFSCVFSISNILCPAQTKTPPSTGAQASEEVGVEQRRLRRRPGSRAALSEIKPRGRFCLIVHFLRCDSGRRGVLGCRVIITLLLPY